MVAAALNTLHYARRLKTAGVPERQAEEMAEALDEVLVAHIATKADFAELRADFAELRGETRTEIASVRTEIAELRTETRTEIALVRTEIANLRTELKGDIAELRVATATEFKNLYRYLWIMGASIVALNVTLTVTLTKVLS